MLVKKKSICLLILGLVMTLCSCSGTTDVGNKITTSNTTLPPENAVTQEQTPASTPEPTPTPEVEIPETITYTGSGDDVITIGAFEDLRVFHITGNAADRHFAVKGYNEKGNYTELLVNTTDPYEGVTFDPKMETTTLEITATGEWSVDVVSILNMPLISAGETLSGDSDSIILLRDYGATATIKGNADERHFAVKSYGAKRDHLLVNTTEEYEGTVMLKDEPVILEVDAESPWTITLN